MSRWTDFLLVIWLLDSTTGHPEFQGYIPNGMQVPNPCDRTTVWPGVGHKNTGGGGSLNSFGKDFMANSNTWTQAFCELDSDGDGMTNGEELGDPLCEWTQGSTPSVTSTANLTHPGVCEPIDSNLCKAKNTWLGCKPPLNSVCPSLNNAGVENVTLTFPSTPIPDVATMYICHGFKLPNDTNYDIIAFEPVIDNAAILHHMLIYGCDSDVTAPPLNSSYACGMGGGRTCRSLIGIWGVGGSGTCLNSQLGFRIGPGAFQYAIVQLHWNNPLEMQNMTDSSGFRVYYTSQLRPNRGEILVSGQSYLDIPPGQASVPFTGGCSSECTQQALPHPIYLTFAILHMHLLGKSGNIGLYRQEKLVTELDVVPNYSYNTPTMVVLNPPIQVNPGDEIRVNCVYDSSRKNTTTYYGESTSDEMCFGFFAYYPLVENFDSCLQWKTIDICDSAGHTIMYPACDFSTFRQLVDLVPQVCAQNCSSRICSVVLGGLVATGCVQRPDVLGFVRAFYRPVDSETLLNCSSSLQSMISDLPTTSTTMYPALIASADRNVVATATGIIGLVMWKVFLLIR